MKNKLLLIYYGLILVLWSALAIFWALMSFQAVQHHYWFWTLVFAMTTLAVLGAGSLTAASFLNTLEKEINR